MVDPRSAILRGKREAGKLHRQFDMRSRIEQGGSRIDVFGTLVQCGNTAFSLSRWMVYSGGFYGYPNARNIDHDKETFERTTLHWST